MPTIDLGAVVGPQGPQGAQGATGAQGVQGNPGPNQVTGNTATTLDGVLYGNGTSVGATPMVRPNLIDNWFFGNPVNQKGSSSYTGEGYGIDRWRAVGSSSSVAIGSNFVTYSSGGSTSLQQYFEKALPSENYTLSCLVRNAARDDDTRWSLMFRAYDDNGTALGSVDIPSSSAGVARLLTATFTGAPKDVRIFFSSKAHSCEIIAVKLECGDTQTLAHQENGVWVLNEIPNMQQELAKCQRYQLAIQRASLVSSFGFGFMNTTTQARITIPTPVTMRQNPTISLLGNSGAISDIKIHQGTSVLAVSEFGPCFITSNGVGVLVDTASNGTANNVAIMRAGSTDVAGILLDANIYPQ